MQTGHLRGIRECIALELFGLSEYLRDTFIAEGHGSSAQAKVEKAATAAASELEEKLRQAALAREKEAEREERGKQRWSDARRKAASGSQTESTKSGHLKHANSDAQSHMLRLLLLGCQVTRVHVTRVFCLETYRISHSRIYAHSCMHVFVQVFLFPMYMTEHIFPLRCSFVPSNKNKAIIKAPRLRHYG
jgi:hypothetical protein